MGYLVTRKSYQFEDKIKVDLVIKIDDQKVEIATKQYRHLVNKAIESAKSFMFDLASVYNDKDISNYSENLNFNYPLRIYPNLEELGFYTLNNIYLKKKLEPVTAS